MLQNQRGRSPKKWDHSGVVVETKPNDQYVIRIAGSGRLTLRNRRFLRKFTPHFNSPTLPSVIPFGGAHSGGVTSVTRTSEPIQKSPSMQNTELGSPGFPQTHCKVHPPSVSDTPPTVVFPSTPINTTEPRLIRLSFGDPKCREQPRVCCSWYCSQPSSCRVYLPPS